MNGFETDPEHTIDDLFGDEPFGVVDEQLFKWLMFSLTGNGRHIGTLDTLNYILFKEKLDVLLDAVYQWHTTAAKKQGD